MPGKPPPGIVGIGSAEPWLGPWLKSMWERVWRGGQDDPFDLTTLQADREFRLIGEMQRLELKAGDVLVVQYDGYMTNEIAERLRQSLEEQFEGHTILVLAEGLRLGVIGKADESVN